MEAVDLTGVLMQKAEETVAMAEAAGHLFRITEAVTAAQAAHTVVAVAVVTPQIIPIIPAQQVQAEHMEEKAGIKQRLLKMELTLRGWM